MLTIYIFTTACIPFMCGPSFTPIHRAKYLSKKNIM